MDIIYKNSSDSDDMLDIDNRILKILERCNSYEEVNLYDPLYKDMMLYLCEYRENVLNWYDFKKDCTILQIGTNFGNLIELLQKRCSRLVSIEPCKKKAEYIQKKYKDLDNALIYNGNIDSIDFNEKFDYIILNNSLEFSKMYTSKPKEAEVLISYAKSYLKDDGKLIILTNNKFAIKYFIGASDIYNREPYSNIMGDNTYTNNKYKLLGKNEIIDIIKKSGIGTYKFFYSLPENKAINVIFTDEFLPTQETMNKYLPIYNNFDFIRFSEINAMKQFLLNGTFDLFCNSYIIECSMDGNVNNAKFISFNNSRKKDYRLVTIINDKDVVKKCVSPESKNHYESFKDNTKRLLMNNNLNVLDYIQDDILKSKFESYQPLDKLLIQYLKEKKTNEFLNEINNYTKFICDNFEVCTDYQNNVFTKYEVDVSNCDLTKFTFINDGYLDLTFQNILVENGNYYIFDQEWYEEKVPVEFLLYRGLKIIFGFGSISSEIVDEISKELDIKEYIALFRQLEEKIQNKINCDSVNKIYSYNYELENNAEFLLNRSINELIVDNEKLKSELEKGQNNKIFKLKQNINRFFKKGRDSGSESKE